MTQNNTRRGFTLIELLVVVLIIGILAAVALPQYQKAVYKARTTEALMILQALTEAQDAYYLANNKYTSDIGELDIDLPAEKIAATWAGMDENQPRSYMYSCKNTGMCLARAFDQEHLPLLQIQLLYSSQNVNQAGKKLCSPNEYEGKLAEKICQSLSSSYQTQSNGFKYYELN